jgi:N6-adenosine-specific RNA methylase IME4
MKHHVIYADPPWAYNARNNQGTKFGGGVHSHYPVMGLEDIKNLGVPSMCEDNAVLFMWATFPRLPQALEVMAAWGFTYKTLGFSWHKTNKDGSLFHGVGSYAKSNCEVCLFGTKGKVGIVKKGQPIPDPKEKLVVRSNFVSSAINAPKERHSKKPDEVRDRIVELFGDVSRIELFARKSSEGWAVWGNEVNEAVEGTITKVEEIIERTVENELPKFRRHKIENGTGYKN